MTITGGYRGKDFPVTISGTYQTRIQSVDLGRAMPMTTDYEMGRTEPTGLAADNESYTGSISWLPIDNTVEAALLFTPTEPTAVAPKGLNDFASMTTGVTVATPKNALVGAKVVSLEYSATVGGAFTGTATLQGTSFTNVGSMVATPALAAPSSYRSPDLHVTIGGTTVARAQRFTLRGTLRVDQLYELGTTAPVSTDFDTPGVTASIDWTESDSAAPVIGAALMTLTNPADIVITLGTGLSKKQLTAVNMVATNVGPRGVVNGYATRRVDYISQGDTTYGGLKIGKTAAA
jgi:hypothetical protein